MKLLQKTVQSEKNRGPKIEAPGSLTLKEQKKKVFLQAESIKGLGMGQMEAFYDSNVGIATRNVCEKCPV